MSFAFSVCHRPSGTILSLTLTRTPDLLEKLVNSHRSRNKLSIGLWNWEELWVHPSHTCCKSLILLHSAMPWIVLNKLPTVCHKTGVILMPVLCPSSIIDFLTIISVHFLITESCLLVQGWSPDCSAGL